MTVTCEIEDYSKPSQPRIRIHNKGILEEIEKAPTIDAVPIIRCKDCKYSHPWYADKSICDLWAETGVDVFNDGFCSYGEGKDDAEQV